MSEGKFLREPLPALLKGGRAKRLGTGVRQARLHFLLGLDDFELRHLLPVPVQEAYRFMEAEREFDTIGLALEYEGQTVELGPYPTGKSQVKRTGCRLFDFVVERKKLKDQGGERLNLEFWLELPDADGSFGRWFFDALGDTVLLTAQVTQPDLPEVEP